MKIHKRQLFALIFTTVLVAFLLRYIGHKHQLARQAETSPYALCTITAIERDLGREVIRIRMKAELFNVNAWTSYPVCEDGDLPPNVFRLGGGRTYEYGESIDILVRPQFRNSGVHYALTTLQFYPGFYGRPDQISCDWRSPTALLEVGKTYKVTPENPLLVARSIEQNGTLNYHWFAVASDVRKKQPGRYLEEQAQRGYATSVEPESRYWLTHLAYDLEPNRVRTRFAWLDQKPSLDAVSKRLDPQYCWVEDSKIISKPIHVETSGAFSNGTQMADMTIALPEIPDDAPDDVWLRMNFSQGSDDHRLVEVPVRRRTFHGEDEYPLGTRVVWQKGQPYKDPVNGTLLPGMDGFQVAPSVRGFLVYGENIYKLDAKTGASVELWSAPATDELKICSACNVSPDGKYLAFIYDDNVQVLDLSTQELVETSDDEDAENVVDIAPSGTCIYKVISDAGKTNVIFRLPEEEEALSAMMSAIPSLRDASERLSRTKCIAISPDQNTVAALWNGGFISVYDIKTGNRLWGRNFSDYVKIIEFSPDGKKLWFTSDTNRELSIDAGEEALNQTYFSLPYADKLARDHLPLLTGPVYWVWSGDRKQFASRIYSRSDVILGNGALFIFDPQDPYSFNAKQSIPTYLPEPAWTFNRAGGAEMKPIGFVGENLLLVECKRSMLPESWKRVTEIICIDLNEVPEI